MTAARFSESDQELEAVLLGRAGLLHLGEIIPTQAAALWQAKLLNAEDIGQLALRWLEEGLDEGSPELAAIALNPPSSLHAVGPAFERALAEMGVAPPALEDSVLVALEFYLRAMIEARSPPMVTMTAINELYYNRGEACLTHPNRESGEPLTYMGQELGLEHLYTWFRELQDAADGSTLFYYTDLPRDQQRAKFEEELIREARVLHAHLCATHPEICQPAAFPDGDQIATSQDRHSHR